MLGNLHFHLLKTHIASNNNMVYVPDFSHWRKKKWLWNVCAFKPGLKKLPLTYGLQELSYKFNWKHMTVQTWPNHKRLTKGKSRSKASRFQFIVCSATVKCYVKLHDQSRRPYKKCKMIYKSNSDWYWSHINSQSAENEVHCVLDVLVCQFSDLTSEIQR